MVKTNIKKSKKKNNNKNYYEIDMLQFNEKINNILNNNSINNNFNSNENNYSILLQNYLNEIFNPMCIVYIQKIILLSKTLKNFQNKINVQKFLINLSKQIFLNQFEILLFYLYVDIIKYNENKISIENFLLFSGFFIKEIVNKNQFEIIIKFFDINVVNNYFEFKTNFITNDVKNKFFNYEEINNVFLILNKPFNIYCKNNFIDYNNIVDRILNMSLPYNENRVSHKNIDINNIKKILLLKKFFYYKILDMIFFSLLIYSIN